MKKYIFFTLVFILSFIVLVMILATITSNYVYKRGFEPWEGESNLLSMKSNQDYDLLIMGMSHARNFTRHKNHLRVEKILNQKIVNIGIGEGRCGINEQLFYLKYFYKKNNSVDKVLYVLAPPMMSKGFVNKTSKTFELEPFRLDFFIQYLGQKADNKFERLFYYLKSKFSRRWLRFKPRSLESKERALEALDSNKIKEGLKLLLVDGERIDEFQRNCKTIENTIKLAMENGSEMIIFISPALFGKWEGHYETLDFLKDMQEKYGTRYYDFSETVFVPELYYDHHHLNSKGVEYFTENYLKDILTNH